MQARNPRFFGQFQLPDAPMNAPTHATPGPTAPPASWLQWAVSWGVRAPSAYNTQPWRFRVQGPELTLLADRTRTRPFTDPADRELEISCGAALSTTRLALSAKGWRTQLRPPEGGAEPDTLARLSLLDRHHTPSLREQQHFQAVLARHSVYAPLEPADLPERALQELQWAVSERGARLDLLDQGAQAQVADAMIDAGMALYTHPETSQELARWWRSSPLSPDGVPAPSQEHVRRLVGASLDPDHPCALSLYHHEVVRRAPLVGVLSTRQDTTADRLLAGHALQHLLLTATVEGLAAAPLNDPLRHPPSAHQLQSILRADQVPQVILCFGAQSSLPQTGRRPLESVLEIIEA